MSAYDVALTDENACPSCGHPLALGCQCSCCEVGDEEFAELLDTLGGAALLDGDVEMALYLFDASDWHAEPGDATVTARMLLLNVALARNGG